jgi:8-oxo-dGTP pyrophosphatase MutT (NUDIX family)
VVLRHGPLDWAIWNREKLAIATRLKTEQVKPVSRGGKKILNKADRAIRVQYGVLPYRFTETNALEVLLVTTRQSRRWIIPKGWPIKGLKPAKSAAREAYEEAGIQGNVGAKSIGAFFYKKSIDANRGTVPCEVRVFPMIVERQLDTWPEAHQREACWFESAKALSAIKEKGLRQLIESFVHRIIAEKLPQRA